MNPASAARIRRSPEAVAVEGIRASTLAALERALPGDCWLVADLSMGAWFGCAAAVQLQRALALPLAGKPVGDDEAPRASALPRYADVVGTAIDAEAAGDATVLQALDLATRVAGEMVGRPPCVVLVLAPRFGFAWEAEDTGFLAFLGQALGETPHRLVVVAGGADCEPLPPRFATRWQGDFELPDAAAPATDLITLVPGVVTPELVAALAPAGVPAPGRRLEGGLWLVAPECRRAPAATGRLAHDRLAVAARNHSWLAAYARCHGNNFFVESLVLCGAAWERAAEGSVGIALKLLARATECARTPADRALCMAHAQGMRISAQRFAEAAAAAEPPASIARDLQAFLHQSKGWGLVMEGQAEAADRYLAQARALWNPDAARREYLYLLNISALARFRSGDRAGAFEFEHEIERQLDGQGRTDAHLGFINSINLARLNRHLRDWEEAHRYYGRAFDTVRGLRSQSDAVYANVCSAIVETERHRPAQALPFLLRASLHWLASDAPEALPRRVVLAILARRPGADECMAEAVSAALHERLGAAAVVALDWPEAAQGSGPAPFFVATGQRVDRLVVGPGFSVAVGAGSVLRPAFDGPRHRRLRRLTYRVMQRLAPAVGLEASRVAEGAGTGITRETAGGEEAGGKEGSGRLVGERECEGHFIVDDRFGCEMALDARAGTETALRLGAGRLVAFGDVRVFDPASAALLERSLAPGLAPGVVRAVGGTVHYRRCRPDKTLSAREASLVEAAAGAPLTLDELALRTGESFSAVLASARALEAAHVLTLTLPGSVP